MKSLDVNTIPYAGKDAVPSVYVNNADTSFGPWDIRIIFTEIETSGVQIVKTVRANVVMTPEHAKALVGALDQAVKQYEKAYQKDVRTPQPAPAIDTGKAN